MYNTVSLSGLPSDQINNQIYQSIQSIQIKYHILTDQSIQIQASMHLIYLISLERRGDYPRTVGLSIFSGSQSGALP
jgi:hypothetical protein